MPNPQIVLKLPPQEFFNAMKQFMANVQKFQVAAQQAYQATPQAQLIQAQTTQSQITSKLKHVSQLFSKLSAMFKQQIARIVNSMGNLGKLFIRSIPFETMAALLRPIGMTISGIFFAGKVVVKTITGGALFAKWIWDKMVGLGDNMLQDFLLATGTMSTVGGLRAFRATFAGLPSDPNALPNVLKARANITTRQYAVLQFLNVRQYRDSVDMMVQATLAAARFMKAQPKGLELRIAEQVGLTSIFSPEYLLALHTLTEKELIEKAKLYEKNKKLLSILTEEAIKGWKNFSLQIKGMGVKITSIIAEKLANPNSNLVKALKDLSEALVKFVRIFLDMPLSQHLINTFEHYLKQFSDWLQSGKLLKAIEDTKKEFKLLVKTLEQAKKAVYEFGTMFGAPPEPTAAPKVQPMIPPSPRVSGVTAPRTRFPAQAPSRAAPAPRTRMPARPPSTSTRRTAPAPAPTPQQPSAPAPPTTTAPPSPPPTAEPPLTPVTPTPVTPTPPLPTTPPTTPVPGAAPAPMPPAPSAPSAPVPTPRTRQPTGVPFPTTAPAPAPAPAPIYRRPMPGRPGVWTRHPSAASQPSDIPLPPYRVPTSPRDPITHQPIDPIYGGDIAVRPPVTTTGVPGLPGGPAGIDPLRPSGRPRDAPFAGDPFTAAGVPGPLGGPAGGRLTGMTPSGRPRDVPFAGAPSSAVGVSGVRGGPAGQAGAREYPFTGAPSSAAGVSGFRGGPSGAPAYGPPKPSWAMRSEDDIIQRQFRTGQRVPIDPRRYPASAPPSAPPRAPIPTTAPSTSATPTGSYPSWAAGTQAYPLPSASAGVRPPFKQAPSALALQPGQTRISEADFYSAAREQFRNSPLNGYVPRDGERWGIKTGSPDEWARLATATAKQESDMRPGHPGGGLLQFEQKDLNRWKSPGNVNDPNVQLKALTNQWSDSIPKSGVFSSPVPKGTPGSDKGWGGAGAYFGSLQYGPNAVNAPARQPNAQAEKHLGAADEAGRRAGEVKAADAPWVAAPSRTPWPGAGPAQGAIMAPNNQPPKAIIIHYTEGGNQNAKQIAAGWGPRTGSQWIVENTGRQVNVREETGHTGTSHIVDVKKDEYTHPQWLKDLGIQNDQVVGIEVAAPPSIKKGGKEYSVEPNQNASQGAVDLVQKYYPNTPVMSHDEANPGHRSIGEGQGPVNAIRNLRGDPTAGAKGDPNAPFLGPLKDPNYGTRLQKEPLGASGLPSGQDTTFTKDWAVPNTLLGRDQWKWNQPVPSGGIPSAQPSTSAAPQGRPQWPRTPGARLTPTPGAPDWATHEQLTVSGKWRQPDGRFPGQQPATTGPVHPGGWSDLPARPGHNYAEAVKNVDPRLREILSASKQQFEALHPGYKIQGSSGYREGAGFHGKNKAIDLVIVKPDGTEIPNEGKLGSKGEPLGDDTGLYHEFARVAKGEQHARYPQLDNDFSWGGSHGTRRPSGGPPDWMHFDLGGERGHWTENRPSVMGELPGLTYGKKQEPPWTAPKKDDPGKLSYDEWTKKYGTSVDHLNPDQIRRAKDPIKYKVDSRNSDQDVSVKEHNDRPAETDHGDTKEKPAESKQAESPVSGGNDHSPDLDS